MRRPNILLIYTDQLRWDALGFSGNRDVQTPHLDKLAAESTNFTHHFVQHPLCMPSRVSFLSGRYPSSLGITRMGVPVPEPLTLLPHYLKGVGYTTANLGKLHFLPHANRDHRLPHPPYGFDQLEVSDEPGVYEDAYRAWVRRKDPAQLEHLSVGLPPATHTWYETMGIADPVQHPNPKARRDFEGAVAFSGADGLTHSAFVADRTREYLERRDDRTPFLCISSFYSPHAPWVVPERYLELYDSETFSLPDYPQNLQAGRAAAHCSDEHLRTARHGYYAMITELDAYVGQILETLEARGLRDDTLVVFTADHGEWLGAHLKYGKGYPGDDAVARVPLLIRQPGAQARTVTEIVEAVDVLPTLLDAAGMQIPPALQGRSLLPVIENRPYEPKEAALMEHHGWKNLRTPNFRYLIHTGGREALWDLRNDPHEYDDVAAEPAYGDVLASHRKLLLEKLLELERPLERTWVY